MILLDWIKKPPKWSDDHDCTVENMKKNLKRMRIYRDLTLQQLSDLSGVSRDTIAGYELNDGKCGKVDIWIALSNALGKDGLDWLFEKHEF